MKGYDYKCPLLNWEKDESFKMELKKDNFTDKIKFR